MRFELTMPTELQPSIGPEDVGSSKSSPERPTSPNGAKGRVKCVVWDLDDTLWSGILLEGATVHLHAPIAQAIERLDERGILHSIASRGDHTTAMRQLAAFGLADYFLHPQITWGAKSVSIRAIADTLRIGLDAIAFVDDQPFERDEVAWELPDVLVVAPADVEQFLSMPETNPYFVTADSRMRRRMYQADLVRDRDEKAFAGPSEAFLTGLRMEFRVGRATAADLQRVQELTVRTNQLNSTGRTYSFQELEELSRSSRHLLLVASLEDRYGPYGKIGLALVECGEEAWTIKLLLMSCRVISRGVGAVLLGHILQRAAAVARPVHADFVPTPRNRAMCVTFRFAGFRDRAAGPNGVRHLVHDSTHPLAMPRFVRVIGDT